MSARDAANTARLAAEAKAKADAMSPAAIAAITAQQVAAGLKSTDPANRLPGETATQANARITQGYKDQPKPDLTKEGAAAGATIEFVRTGAGGVGTYKEVFPMGAPIPTNRTTESGNVYDAQGNLVSGTGLKTTGTGTKTTVTPVSPTPVTPTPAVPTPGGTPERPIGTPPAFVYDPLSKTYKMPAKPAEGDWSWDNNSGWVSTKVVPGATGMEAGSEKTLALDTFKNTLALYFGAKEMSQPWANALFKVVSSYYKSGADIQESLNLALQDARNKPELEPFTKRFAGVFALQDRRAAGEALDVPTIAEFFTSQVALGDRLREVGLGDLATNEILGEVLGTGKSVAAALGLVNNVFMAIDNAPKALKEDLAVVAPGVDRTSIAKALLLGKRGAEELQKKIDQVKVFSAAKSQGIKIADDLAADYAARGIDYGTALEGFGTVAMGSPTMQKLTEISNQTKSTSEAAQQTLMKSIFEKDVKAQEQIRLEAEKEAARFGGASGTMGSRSLASRNRANRII
jgi:hypothetical protein